MLQTVHDAGLLIMQWIAHVGILGYDNSLELCHTIAVLSLAIWDGVTGKVLIALADQTRHETPLPKSNVTRKLAFSLSYPIVEFSKSIVERLTFLIHHTEYLIRVRLSAMLHSKELDNLWTMLELSTCTISSTVTYGGIELPTLSDYINMRW